MTELVESLPRGRTPVVVAPPAGSEFEFGTEGYRARVYARAILSSVPSGVPVIVSDDPATWRAVDLLERRNPLIGVLHADEATYYALASRFHESAAAIVSVSKRVFARAEATLGTWRTIADVIPCGVPLFPYEPRQQTNTVELRLVWAGRVVEAQKRVSDLCAIARRLRAVGCAFRLDVVGDGEDMGSLRSCVERAELADCVRFHGWVSSSALISILQQADLMLLPSNYEGMPVAAMEALAAGCAVIGSDTCGLEEFTATASARDGLWIFPRGDVLAAVDAIQMASAVPSERRRKAARSLAETEFAIAVCMERYEALLARLRGVAPPSITISLRHPADVTSWLLSRARLMRAYAAKHVAGRERSRERILSLAA